ncbi:MAG: PorP/SprF family type IX secretion system membrane protein [Chitinophagaceae bacterium]|nr:PorP/SprF family type IX secretion system membrane protein [Chitinophagaceae bacterium]
MKRLFVSLGLLLSMGAYAQDVHFTQYFTSPLTLNPANTGLVSCDWRLSGNYRSQWGSVNATPYITGTVSFDMATLKGKLNGDAVGVGLVAVYDKSGTGALQNITTGLSLSYIKKLGDDEYKPKNLSIGIQSYLVQKSIDFNKLKFEDQYDAVTGTTPYQTKEFIGSSDLTYPDFNAGIMYSGYVTERSNMYAGLSYYHITQPVETFLNGTHKINSRITASLGGSLQMSEKTMLFASGMYQQQGKASEIVLGAATGFIMNPNHEDEIANSVFYLGAWYRYGDAIAPYVGFEWSKAKLGVSYDVNLSGFTPATKGNGALEISLIYNGCIIKNDNRSYNFSCPRF